MHLNKRYDIFISYRHNNMTLVGELVHKLEKYYDVFWDQRLESGFWDEQLERAIDDSSVVVINFNTNSLKKNKKGEDWFYREIVYSMTHKEKENIIPVCYDGFEFPEVFDIEGITPEEKEKLETLRDKYQRIIDIKELDKIVEKLIVYLLGLGITPKEPYMPEEREDVYLSFKEFAPVQSFKGRRQELDKILELVHTNDMVFLSGMGGIGKTELAKKFMEEMTGGYRCVFCRYEGSLKNTLSKLEIVGIDNDNFADREKALRRLLSRKVVLVIDNFDFEGDDIDSYIYEFCNYPCKKLITTRNNFSEIEFPCEVGFVSLGALEDDELKALFEEKYTKEITDLQLEKILKFTGRLTLAVPILASLCVKSDMTVDELCEKIGAGLKSLESSESVHYMKDGNKKGNVPDIIRTLFDMENMSEGKKNTLRNLSLLLFMQVTKSIYKEFALSDGTGNLDDFNELVEMGWIKETPVDDESACVYELHPLINELVKEDLMPSPINCGAVFASVEKKKESLLGSVKWDFWRGFLSGINIYNEANYDYVIELEKKINDLRYYVDKIVYASQTIDVLYEKIKSILLEKDSFDDKDAFLAAKLMGVEAVISDYKTMSAFAEKCFAAKAEKKITTETIRYFIKRFTDAVAAQMSNSDSTQAPACVLYTQYEALCKKYSTFRQRRKHAKRIFWVQKILKMREAANAEQTALGEEVRQADCIEQAFEITEKLWQRMNLEKFFSENIFMVFLREDMTEEEADKIMAATLDRYGERDLTDEFGIDEGMFIRRAFIRSYMTKKLTCLSFERCHEFVCKMNYGRNTKLVAAIMCGDSNRIYEQVKETLYCVPAKEKTPEQLNKESLNLSLAVAETDYLRGLDAQAELILGYISELEKVSVSDRRYQEAVLVWYTALGMAFKNEETKKQLRQMHRQYELKVSGLSFSQQED